MQLLGVQPCPEQSLGALKSEPARIGKTKPACIGRQRQPERPGNFSIDNDIEFIQQPEHQARCGRSFRHHQVRIERILPSEEVMVNTNPLLPLCENHRLENTSASRLTGIKKNTYIELPGESAGAGAIHRLNGSRSDNSLETLIDIGLAEYASFLAELPETDREGNGAADRIPVRIYVSGDQDFPGLAQDLRQLAQDLGNRSTTNIIAKIPDQRVFI